MTSGRYPRRITPAAVAFVVTAALARSAAAQAGPAVPTDPTASSATLTVPYLPQSEDLCGGAAAAMVMRYWGAQDVYPDAFASLVDRSAGGIRTGALASSLQARGWTPLVESGSIERLQEQVARRRPVIALIAVGRGRYHYVVVLGRHDGRTIVHDPARAPDRSLSDNGFDRAWAATDRWMLTLLPPADLHADAPPHDVTSAPAPASCAALVSRGIAVAERDRASSRPLLESATKACPQSSAPWRELAGLDALDKNWRAAAEHAGRAVRLDSGDQYAWRLLATAEYLSENGEAALDAWNHTGEPRIDLVNVTGLDRTRYSIVYDATGLAPRELLTPSTLRLAERRVADLPSIATARVSYRPVENGRAQVDVAVVERDAYPRGLSAIAALGIGATVDRAIDASVSSSTGGGERIDASWRWWAHRPAVSAAFIAPAPFLHGVWQIDAAHETETFAGGVQQTRTRIGGGFGAWLTDRLRISGIAGIDRWTNRERQPMVGGGVEFQPVPDYLTLRVQASHWTGSDAFSIGSIDARFTNSAVRSGTVWVARAGAAAATDDAPAMTWPGADTGHVRDTLLRAHPLLDDGVISGGVFGKRLVDAGVELQRWSRPSKWLLQYAPAVFVDAAQATRGLPSSLSAMQVDAGVGVRISAPGAGVLRMDLAHGLRDGRTAFSVVWER
ncbi:MAG TPA: C39 family peptidase [Vicinamibacterales bacterium]|nr:C39 family peptidase [Vicinamibacterales bacterium]